MAVLNRRPLLLLLLIRRRRRRRRERKRIWVRDIFKKRLQLGEYHSLINEMRLTDHQSFYRYFHMSPERFAHLLSLVGPAITRQTTSFRQPIHADERLAITLRYLVTGDSMQTISFSYRVGHSTICGIIDSTCDALWNVLSCEYLRRPSTPEEWIKISEGFQQLWNFPHCLGAIDGKHIVMQAPANSGSNFYNYKGTFSIILLAVCDAQYCFTLLDIGDTGRQSDGGVLANSAFGRSLESGSLSLPCPKPLPGQSSSVPYYFVGDSAFPLKTYMLRPFPGRFLPEDKQIFNYRLSRARRVIENTFGIMATKFRIFRRSIVANPDKVTKITQAACCLHNYLRISEINNPPSARFYCPPGFVDVEDNDGNVIPGDWRSEISPSALQSVQRTGSNTYSRSASDLRDSIMTFMTTPQGEVPWQYAHVRSHGNRLQ